MQLFPKCTIEDIGRFWKILGLLFTGINIFVLLCLISSNEPPFLGKFPEMGWKQIVVPVEWD